MTQQKWNSLIVIETIKELHAAGHPLNSNYAQVRQMRLYVAATRYYGSWGSAVEAAGFDYTVIRKKEQKPVTVAMVVKEIRERVTAGQHVGGGIVSKEDLRLYSRAKRLFPGENYWKKALSAAGVNYNNLPDPKLIWSRKKILKTIRNRYKENLPLYANHLANNGLAGLVGAGKRIFGSWRAAIVAAGLNYDNVRAMKLNYWTPELVVEEIKGYVDAGNRLSLKSTQQDRADLVGAAIKYFGSWDRAVTSAGFNYQEHCRVRSTKFWLNQMSQSSYENLVSQSRVRLMKTRKPQKRKGTR